MIRPTAQGLLQAVRRWLRSNEVLSCLVQRHGLAEDEARAWSDDSLRSLARHGTIPIPSRRCKRRRESAAGALLNMIAQTMPSEACFKGRCLIGFSALLGFLAAIFFTTLE